MPPPDSEPTEYLLAQLCRLHYKRARAQLEALGLYRGQPPLLHILYDEEGLAQTELATRLHVTQATVTKMLQRMEKAGWVHRRTDAHDQRVTRVYLTVAGRAIQEEMAAVLRRLDEEALAGFTAEERALFRRFLLRARDNLVQAQGRAAAGVR